VKILLQKPGSDAAAWADALRVALPEATIHRWPDGAQDPMDYALVWKPPVELVERLEESKAVFNLGAGVDALLGKSQWSSTRLIRLEDAGMAVQMSEYVAYAVLRWYREFAAYEVAQRERVWQPRRRLDKGNFGVGVLGLGLLGTEVAATLKSLGFPVSGWSRSPKAVEGVRTFAGPAQLEAFLRSTRVLVCMLPLTPATRGLVDRNVLSRLPRGAYFINIARGALCVDGDLVAAIEDGHIAGAMLDVFAEEPLPASSPFWHHPRIVVTPHVSAVTLMDESIAQIAAKIRRLEAGLSVTGIVDPAHAY